MVAGVVGCLGELLDCEIRRGEIRVAEAEVDDVVAGATKLERQVADHREDVRRQVVDAAKLHRHKPTRLEERRFRSQPCTR